MLLLHSIGTRQSVYVKLLYIQDENAKGADNAKFSRSAM